jgi:serine protease Do
VALSLLDSSEAQSDLTRPAADAPVFAAPAAGSRSFADVIEQVSPAVVNISVAKIVRPMPTAGGRQGAPAPMDDFFSRFFGTPGYPGGAMPAPRRSEGQGSGFIIDESGYVATNNHVVDGAEEIIVTLASGEELTAEVIGTDPQTDIALLRVDTDSAGLTGKLSALQFGDSDRTRVGDWVLAIGNPFGLGGTATAGIVSARGRDIASGPYDDYLQIDAPINAGNSGGPVFNAAGEVIGINTAIFSPNGGNIGIGFAIPSSQAEQILAQLREGGSVTRGWLGVQIQPIDRDLAEVFGLEDVAGALVAEVVEFSPAAKGGLEVGDIVTSVDGRPVDSPRDLARTVALHDAGATVEVGVIRDGRARALSIELGERSTDGAVARGGPAGTRGSGDATRALGLELEDLDARARDSLGLDPEVRGAVVTGVAPGSEAAARGLRPGDVIVSVNRSATPDAAAAVDALSAARKANRQALVLVRRGDSQQFLALGAA